MNDTWQLPAGGSCCFNYTLCSYTQGYRHPDMAKWTVTDNGAVAKQVSYVEGGSHVVYSDLESPLLSLLNVCCVEFNYVNHRPSTLSVFGFWNETDHELFQGPDVHNTAGKTIIITVPRYIKTLKFRAYGRGGSSADYVALHYVTFHLGDCSGPECNFTSSTGQLPTLCGWETNGWEAGQYSNIFPAVARLNDDVAAGTLTTGLVKATPKGGICVQFNYIDSINDTLSMLMLAGDLDEVSVWVSTNNGLQSVQSARAAVYISSDSAFKLVFSAKRCHNPHSVIVIFNVTSTPITDIYPPSPCQQLSLEHALPIPQYEGCVLNPSTTTTTEILPSSTRVTGKPGTTNSSPSSSGHATSAEVTTKGWEASLSTHSATGESTDTTVDAQTNSDADNTGVAVGAALAVIGLIGAAVIIAVVLWRKRKHKGRGAKDKNVLKSKMVDLQQSGSLHGNKAGPASQTTYAETRNPVFSPSLHSAGDDSEVNHTEHSENPYDVAAPDLATSDGYSHVDILGPDEKKKQKTSITNPYELAGAMPSADNDTDEYHHLTVQPGATKPKVNSARSPTQPDYSHIGGHSKHQPLDVYSVPGKKGTSPAAANQQEDEYNRINSKQPSGTKRQGDVTPDVYNRLEQVNAGFDEGTEAAECEYNKVGEKIPTSKQPRGATRDAYDRIDGVVPPDGNPGGFEKGKTGEESDQYNTLNFDEGEQRSQNAASDKKKTTQPRKAYDHVQDDFQDTYAKTQRSKRERVIDSNYDHVTPDETRVN